MFVVIIEQISHFMINILFIIMVSIDITNMDICIRYKILGADRLSMNIDNY